MSWEGQALSHLLEPQAQLMRSLRRAAQPVAFFLLTSVAIAHGECAWVLWIKSTTGRGASFHAEPYRPSDTYDTKQKCETWVRGTIQFMIDNQGNSRVTSLGNDVRTASISSSRAPLTPGVLFTCDGWCSAHASVVDLLPFSRPRR